MGRIVSDNAGKRLEQRFAKRRRENLGGRGGGGVEQACHLMEFDNG